MDEHGASASPSTQGKFNYLVFEATAGRSCVVYCLVSSFP